MPAKSHGLSTDELSILKAALIKAEGAWTNSGNKKEGDWVFSFERADRARKLHDNLIDAIQIVVVYEPPDQDLL